MNKMNLEDKLNELIEEFGDTANPQNRKMAKKMAELSKQAQTNRKEIEESINYLQELLDFLRVCIKYQAFDLEATRRENEVLIKLLWESDE